MVADRGFSMDMPGVYYVGREGDTLWNLSAAMPAEEIDISRPEIDVALALIEYARDQLMTARNHMGCRGVSNGQ